MPTYQLGTSGGRGGGWSAPIAIATNQSDTDRALADVALLLRSPLLAEILGAILLEGGEWTADELSAVTEAPYATVTKELRRLEREDRKSVV